MAKIIELDYSPRWYQTEFEAAMFSGCRRAFLLYHRRAGKDFACWNFLVNCAMADTPALYYYILPTYRQGKKVIWDGIDESGNRFINAIPKDLILGKPNETEMKIRLVNGSIIQIVGSDKYDSLRGTNCYGVVLSEYAAQAPQIWSEVLSPILVKNNGWAVFNTTPLGKNHAYTLWNTASESKNWYTKMLTIEDTGLVDISLLDRERSEGKSEEVIQQEYFCSFERGIDGSYYGRLMLTAKNDGRIGNVPHDPLMQVHCAMDLGMDDATAIWWWQRLGPEIRFIDYYEMSGEALSHYVNVINSKEYTYGDVYVPHDIKVRELGTGVARLEILAGLGVHARIVPDVGLQNGIEAARGTIPRCWFDATKCKKGIEALEMYHKEYNAELDVYSTRPVHDRWSHGADAFRYASIAIKRQRELSNDNIKELNKTLRARI